MPPPGGIAAPFPEVPLTLGDSNLTGGVGQTETITAGNTLTFNNGSSAAS
jgi:hypothetical protein